MTIKAICEILCLLTDYYKEIDIDFNHAQKIVYVWEGKNGKLLCRLNYDN